MNVKAVGRLHPKGTSKKTGSPYNKLHIRIHSPQQLPRVIPEQIARVLLQSA